MSTPRDLHLLHRPTTTPVRSLAFDESATVTAVAGAGRPAMARSAARTDSTVRAALAAPAARGGRLPGIGGVTVEELQAAYDAARSGTFAQARRGYAPQQGRYAPARGRYADLPTTSSPYAGDGDAGHGPALRVPGRLRSRIAVRTSQTTQRRSDSAAQSWPSWRRTLGPGRRRSR